MTKPMSLKIENLTKHYTLPQGELAVLTGVDLTVQPGEFISIVGASGCGKSTLLRLIGGLEQVSEGRILFDETPIQKPGLDRGMVFQESRLFPWFTVEENIAFGWRSRRRAPPTCKVSCAPCSPPRRRRAAASGSSSM